MPTWYDLDVLVVDTQHGVPPLATYGGTITPQQHRWLQLDVPLFAEAMRACDAATVSTPTLAQRWQAPRRFGRRPRLGVASGTKAHTQV